LSQLEDLAQKTQVVSKWCDGVYNALKKTQQTHPSARRFRTAEQAELTPLACINIYMLLVSFAQRAIESIANYQNHIRFTEGREDVALSEGFDDGTVVQWFPLTRLNPFQRCHGFVPCMRPVWIASSI
jgi:hypothetical protein